ncbi:unnamed protein product [Porites evermanni]|uniref:Integrase zinc-binding domain-containing protein n=1 Tax=Porites evermanni TaxID=104178 RepID=A0ABN8Q8G6_9CNID|nr:unnamed protein product [Porites evermanni]
MCQVQVNGKVVEMMIDTGASVNLLDEATFHRIDCGNKLLEHAHSKIYSYGFDTPLPLLGTPSRTITSSSNSTTTQLHVVKRNMGNLLSYNTAQKLGLITISVNTTTVTDVNKNSPESLQEEFECLFGGIGRLRNKIVRLHVDPDMTPRQQPHRRIPFHVRGDVEKELESPEVQDYKRLKDEFSVYNGVALRMNRIFIPLTLRSRAVELARLGHQGIVKTKQLIRDKVWFPGIDKLTEDKVKKKLSLVPSSDSEITTNRTSSNVHTSQCTLKGSCS